MASCSTSRWVSTAPYVKLTVTTASSTDTKVTLSWTLQYIADYAANTSSNRDYTVKIDGSTVKTGSYNIDGKTGTNTIASGTKDITKGTSAKNVSFSVSFGFNLTWSGSYKGTLTASSTISVPKKTSYTITYNANGGSGAPSSQTKWYGTDLTLSSTKPTKSGYTFMGWGTSSSDTSVNYASGATYTTNASDTLYAIWRKTIKLTYSANGGSNAPDAVTKYVYNSTTSYKFTLSTTKPTKTGYTFLGWSTSSTATTASYSAGGTITLSTSDTLYAVWKANTFPITFNANGGSGGPTSATKTYGVDLTLPTSTPTRTNYTFLGWATSKTATSATYSAGGKYTANTGGTLYAVWKLNYTKPRINSLSISRDSTTPTSALISFKWATDKTVSSIKVQWNSGSGWSTAKTISASGTSGTITKHKIDGVTFSTETTYTVRVTVADSNGSMYRNVTLSSELFPIDVKAGGTGLAIGKTAEEDGYLDVGWPLKLRKGIVQKILWSGSRYMLGNDDQTINLTDSIKAQPSGIVLIFSAYDSDAGAALDHHFNVHFVPKTHVSNFPGCGTQFLLCSNSVLSVVGSKYLYISDNKIVGHNNNNASGTSDSGIKYNNKHFVLRYVIGV